MSIIIKVKHEDKEYTLSLAEAARLINMAESTFSAKWRQRKLMQCEDQACFDHIKRFRNKINKKTAPNRGRVTEAAAERKEEAALKKHKRYFDLFNYGAAI